MGRKMVKVRTIESDIFGYPVVENPINSNRKGKDNERVASKWFSEWTGQPFTRVPSSGGLRWAGTANVCGDLVCENPDFNMPFTIETKHKKALYFSPRLRNNSSVYSVLDQCLEDCTRSGKKPMLFLRKDGMPKGKYIVYFMQQDALYLQSFINPVSIGLRNDGLSIYGYNSDDLVTINFGDFVKNL